MIIPRVAIFSLPIFPSCMYLLLHQIIYIISEKSMTESIVRISRTVHRNPHVSRVSSPEISSAASARNDTVINSANQPQVIADFYFTIAIIKTSRGRFLVGAPGRLPLGVSRFSMRFYRPVVFFSRMLRTSDAKRARDKKRRDISEQRLMSAGHCILHCCVSQNLSETISYNLWNLWNLQHGSRTRTARCFVK